MRDRRSILRGLAAAPLAGVAGMAAIGANPKDASGLVTIEELAALPFKALVHAPDEWVPPSNEEWAGHADPVLVSTRLAYLTLFKSKDELAGMVDRMCSTDEGQDLFETTIANLQSAQSYFERYTKVLQMAEVRLMCASAVGCVSEGGEA